MTDRIICTHHAIKTNHVHDRPYLLTSFSDPILTLTAIKSFISDFQHLFQRCYFGQGNVIL